MDKKELASNYYKNGYNCAQAVVLAFQPEMGMEKDTLAKLSMGFGGGVARLQNVCGAVLGMVTVLSYLKSTNDKLETYNFIQGACKQFEQKVSSIICKQIKEGQDQQSIKYTCADLCGIAAQITQEYLNK